MKLIAFVISLALISGAFADDAALTKILTDNKCDKCHKVEALGLTTAKGKAPDLSKLSDTLKGYDKGSKAWLKGWLKKEIAVKGSKHKASWKGTDAELDQLVDGLVELDSRK